MARLYYNFFFRPELGGDKGEVGDLTSSGRSTRDCIKSWFCFGLEIERFCPLCLDVYLVFLRLSFDATRSI